MTSIYNCYRFFIESENIPSESVCLKEFQHVPLIIATFVVGFHLFWLQLLFLFIFSCELVSRSYITTPPNYNCYICCLISFVMVTMAPAPPTPFQKLWKSICCLWFCGWRGAPGPPHLTPKTMKNHVFSLILWVGEGHPAPPPHSQNYGNLKVFFDFVGGGGDGGGHPPPPPHSKNYENQYVFFDFVGWRGHPAPPPPHSKNYENPNVFFDFVGGWGGTPLVLFSLVLII